MDGVVFPLLPKSRAALRIGSRVEERVALAACLPVERTLPRKVLAGEPPVPHNSIDQKSCKPRSGPALRGDGRPTFDVTSGFLPLTFVD